MVLGGLVPVPAQPFTTWSLDKFLHLIPQKLSLLLTEECFACLWGVDRLKVRENVNMLNTAVNTHPNALMGLGGLG